MAGRRAAETLRASGFEGRVVLVGGDPGMPEERPRIEWLNDHVDRIDYANRFAWLRHHGLVCFDACLLATGGRARMPSETGGVRQAYPLRTKAEGQRLLETMNGARTVAVVGGGIHGLEFAANARAYGLEVTVIESAPYILNQSIPQGFAERLRAKHESHGVQFVFASEPPGISKSAAGISIHTDRGAEDFDFCVLALGQLPNDDLAIFSGIDANNGILVDAYCRTSAPGIYAAGACANFPLGKDRRSTRLDSCQNALDQAVVAARNMLGELIEYRPVPWLSTDQYDWNLQILGVFDAQVERWTERSVGEGRTLLMGLRHGVIVYALAVNHGAELRAVRRLVEDAVPVDLCEFEKLIRDFESEESTRLDSLLTTNS